MKPEEMKQCTDKLINYVDKKNKRLIHKADTQGTDKVILHLLRKLKKNPDCVLAGRAFPIALPTYTINDKEVTCINYNVNRSNIFNEYFAYCPYFIFDIKILFSMVKLQEKLQKIGLCAIFCEDNYFVVKPLEKVLEEKNKIKKVTPKRCK